MPEDNEWTRIKNTDAEYNRQGLVRRFAASPDGRWPKHFFFKPRKNRKSVGYSLRTKKENGAVVTRFYAVSYLTGQFVNDEWLDWARKESARLNAELFSKNTKSLGAKCLKSKKRTEQMKANQYGWDSDPYDGELAALMRKTYIMS